MRSDVHAVPPGSSLVDAAMARTTWRDEGGRLVLAYDPQLMRTLEAVDADAPIPPLWHLFEPLKRVPVLVLRGENSDILSAETLTAMQASHPGLQAVTVPGQGHAPLLRGEWVQRIERFVDETETAARRP